MRLASSTLGSAEQGRAAYPIEIHSDEIGSWPWASRSISVVLRLQWSLGPRCRQIRQPVALQSLPDGHPTPPRFAGRLCNAFPALIRSRSTSEDVQVFGLVPRFLPEVFLRMWIIELSTVSVVTSASTPRCCYCDKRSRMKWWRWRREGS